MNKHTMLKETEDFFNKFYERLRFYANLYKNELRIPTKEIEDKPELCYAKQFFIDPLNDQSDEERENWASKIL